MEKLRSTTEGEKHTRFFFSQLAPKSLHQIGLQLVSISLIDSLMAVGKSKKGKKLKPSTETLFETINLIRISFTPRIPTHQVVWKLLLTLLRSIHTKRLRRR